MGPNQFPTDKYYPTLYQDREGSIEGDIREGSLS